MLLLLSHEEHYENEDMGVAQRHGFEECTVLPKGIVELRVARRERGSGCRSSEEE